MPAGLLLGARLATLNDYPHRVRALLLAVTAALITFLTLSIATAPQILTAQHAHETARHVISSSPKGEPRLWASNSRSSWNGHQIGVLSVAGPTTAPTPPGIPALPRPGQVYLSPDLRALTHDDPLVRTLFTGYTDLGDITAPGLRDPHELRAVTSADRTAPEMRPATGFGPGAYPATAPDRLLNTVLSLVMGVLLLIPALALVLVSTRMSSRQRHTRIVSLRLLGLSRTRIRTIMAVETLLITAPATLTGLTLHLLARTHLTRVPGLDFGYYPQDAHLPAPIVLAVTVTVIAIFTLTATAVSADGAVSLRPRLTFTPVHRHPIIVLAVSVIVLAFLRFADHLPDGVGALASWVTIGIVMISLAWSGPALLQLTATHLIPRTRSGGLLIGLRISHHEPGTTARMAAVMSIVIVAIGATLPFVAILNGGPPNPAADTRRTQATGVTISIDGITATDAAQAAPTTSTVLNTRQLKGNRHDGITVLYATCADLQTMTKTRVRHCTSKPQWLSVNGDDLDFPSRSTSIPGPEGTRIPLPPTHRTVTAVGASVNLTDALVLPPILRSPRPASSDGAILLVRPQDVPLTLARLHALAPAAHTNLGEYTDPTTHSGNFPAQVRLVLFGSLLCLALAVLALTVAALGDTLTRRNRITPILALGAPRRDILHAHLAATVLPLTLLGVLASTVAWITGQAMRGLDDRAVPDPHLYPFLALGSITAALLIGAITAPPLLTALRTTELRSQD